METCPKCGYCPHCGRQTNPPPFLPYIQPHSPFTQPYPGQGGTSGPYKGPPYTVWN